MVMLPPLLLPFPPGQRAPPNHLRDGDVLGRPCYMSCPPVLLDHGLDVEGVRPGFLHRRGGCLVLSSAIVLPGLEVAGRRLPPPYVEGSAHHEPGLPPELGSLRGRQAPVLTPPEHGGEAGGLEALDDPASGGAGFPQVALGVPQSPPLSNATFEVDARMPPGDDHCSENFHAGLVAQLAVQLLTKPRLLDFHTDGLELFREYPVHVLGLARRTGQHDQVVRESEQGQVDRVVSRKAQPIPFVGPPLQHLPQGDVERQVEGGARVGAALRETAVSRRGVTVHVGAGELRLGHGRPPQADDSGDHGWVEAGCPQSLDCRRFVDPVECLRNVDFEGHIINTPLMGPFKSEYQCARDLRGLSVLAARVLLREKVVLDRRPRLRHQDLREHLHQDGDDGDRPEVVEGASLRLLPDQDRHRRAPRCRPNLLHRRVAREVRQQVGEVLRDLGREVLERFGQ
eukprot:16441611-Heterocapsa_arctica.AAC.2